MNALLSILIFLAITAQQTLTVTSEPITINALWMENGNYEVDFQLVHVAGTIYTLHYKDQPTGFSCLKIEDNYLVKYKGEHRGWLMATNARNHFDFKDKKTR